MQKNLILIFFSAIFSLSNAQIIDVDYLTKEEVEAENAEEESEPVQVLGRGFMDVFSNGKMQGTAQLLKLRIGEPGKFSMPFYLLVGASGDGLGNTAINENTAANLLNPVGGILNGTINGQNNMFKSSSGITSLKLSYQISGKLVNAKDSLTLESKFLGSAYANAGLFFQTAAWEDGALDNIGVFWIQAKMTSSFGFERNSLKSVFGSQLDDNYFLGYSIDAGLEINNRVNIKAGIYQYLNNQEVNLFTKPVLKFSLDYNLK